MVKTIQHQSSQLVFGEGLDENLNTLLKENYANSKKVIITDENVFDIWVENLITSVEELNGAEIIQLPAGEDYKTIEISYQVWESLTDYKIGRQDVILNFGGGVITDMGGFIASTYKRGIDFINIPTTLLSQVDASVGGKTGVDLGGHKNQIGVFALPTFVCIDYKYLNTLADKQLVSGFAEMLKHGLIQSESHWTNLINLKTLTVDTISKLIFESVNIKHQVVTKDPTEKSLRKSLNFGHTIGHAFEGYLLNQNQMVPHGFAVAWGMLVEAKISVLTNGFNEKDYLIIKDFIIKTFPKCTINSESINDLIELMRHDKKNNGTEINFSLLNSIGNCKINCEVEEEIISDVLEAFLA